MKPPKILYRFHHFFCDRMFSRDPPKLFFHERVGHAIVKAILEHLEYLEMKPSLDRMRHEVETLEKLASDIERVRKKYGI